MIDTYEFAYTNCVLMQPDGSVHTITVIGTAIRLLDNIKQTGVNTTQDGTTDIYIYVKNFNNCMQLLRHIIMSS